MVDPGWASPESVEAEVGAILARLHHSGWSVGDYQVEGPEGRAWLVTGTNGENVIRAEGRTLVEAWRRAERQALEVGMIRVSFNPQITRS